MSDHRPSRLSQRLRRARASGDTGSMMLGLLASFMISAMVVTMLMTVRTGQDKTSHDQRYLASVQGADAGVQDALLQISQTDADSNVVSIPGTSTIDGVHYSWTATRAAKGLEWTVTSTVTAKAGQGQSSRAVVAKVKQDPLFPLAAFADSQIAFNGDNAAVSYPTTGFGIVGSNGTLELKNNTVADGAVLYDFENEPNTDRCQNGPCATKLTTVDASLDIKGAVQQDGFIKQKLDACKLANGGTLPAFVGTTIAPKADGSPYCFSSFHANSDNFQITGTGPVQIYVEGDVTLGNKNHSSVNLGAPAAPESIRLQIYSLGTTVGMYNQSNMAAAIYAPNATCGGVTSNAGSDFYGSLICNVIDNVGGWTFHYDTRLSAVGNGRWGLGEYNEQ